MGRSKRVALAVLGIYAVVLFWSLHLTPLWLDEIQQFASSRNITFAELVRWVQLNAGASPLPYLAQHVFVQWFGYSAPAVRFPAALCSILAGLTFAAICPWFLQRSHWAALILFLALPVQFRYGIEARVYSQGLFFSVLTMWLFLRLEENPSGRLTILYGLSIAAGLYSQPLTVFPVLAQILFARGRRILAACAAIASYLPWYFFQHRAQLEYARVIPPRPFFSLSQIEPRALVHDLTGGGYGTTLCLIVLAAWCLKEITKPRLLFVTVAIAMVGPIAMDAVFNYFFAERQLLYAMPAWVLLAAKGFERLRSDSRGLFSCVLLAAFLIAASLKDFRQAVTPRDNLAATADAIATHLRPAACVVAAPPEQVMFYLFFHPELEARVCPGDMNDPEAMGAISGYTTAAEKTTLLNSLSSRFEQFENIHIGQSELVLFRHK